jgi:hypothetical protein
MPVAVAIAVAIAIAIATPWWAKIVVAGLQRCGHNRVGRRNGSAGPDGPETKRTDDHGC